MISSPVVLFLIVKSPVDCTYVANIFKYILSGSTVTLPALYTVKVLKLVGPVRVGRVCVPTSDGLSDVCDTDRILTLEPLDVNVIRPLPLTGVFECPRY